MCWLSNLLKKPSPLELSPSDWLPKEAITPYEVMGHIQIDLSKLLPGLSKPPKVWIPGVPATGSMIPNFHKEHNNILVAGANKADHAQIIDHLQVGDIAVYRVMSDTDDDPADFSKANAPYGYAIHRIISIGTDAQGRYFNFKGDNNPVKDRYKARDFNILWASVGTIF